MNKKGYTLIELIVCIFIVGIMTVIIAPVGFMLFRTSDGSRVGVISKLSKRGSICQTWEAELMVGAVTNGQGGTYTPEKWRFTPGDDIVSATKDAMVSGARVEVEYKQKPPLLTICKSETGYIATGIKPTGK
jgi:prepilin-type N-terminal cleavage/methylation domain-containing protein